MAITLAEITQAIDTARAAVPGARWLTRAHCHGYPWLLDDDNRTVYLDGDLNPEQAAVALLDSVDALVAAAASGRRALPLRLVPTQGDELAERRTVQSLG